MKKLFGKSNKEDHNFWMSYTDLMSGFLVVFIVACYVYQSRFDKIVSMISDAGCTVEDVEQMLKWHKENGNLVNINDDFKGVFQGIEGVEFVKEEGSIRLYPTYKSVRDSILFETGKTEIQQNLKDRLNRFGRGFICRAMELKQRGKNVSEIRIEGHTDTDGYFFGENGNLMLSSRRAYAVYEYIYNYCCQTDEEKRFVKQHVISVGYSSQKIITDPVTGRENKAKSRRIEFRIISK